MKLTRKLKAFFKLICLCGWAVIVILFYLTILLLKLSPYILVLAITVWFITQVLL